jgi:hypothetical protein
MNAETTTIDIATIAQWGPARHVNTRLGERNGRSGPEQGRASSRRGFVGDRSRQFYRQHLLVVADHR